MFKIIRRGTASIEVLNQRMQHFSGSHTIITVNNMRQTYGILLLLFSTINERIFVSSNKHIM